MFIKRKVNFVIYCVTISLISASGANRASAEASRIVDLDTVLSKALSSSALAKEIDFRRVEKYSEAIELRTLPNPELESQVRIPVATPEERADTEVEVGLTQAFRISHFGLRGQVSRLLEQAGDNEQKVALLELVQTIRLAYVKAWALQEKERTLEIARARAESIGQTLREGAGKGLFNLGDAKLFKAEVAKVSADLTGVRADLNRAKAALIRMSGHPNELRTLVRPAALALPERAKILADLDRGALPLQERYDLLEKLAKQQVELSRKDSFPALSPMLGYERTAEATDQVMLGISFELPFSDRNQAERKRQTAQQQVARAQRRYVKSDAFKQEVGLLLDSLTSSVSQAEEYSRSVVPAIEEALNIYQNQLRQGQGSVLQIWQVQRELLEANERSLEFAVKAVAERSEISVLLAQDI